MAYDKINMNWDMDFKGEMESPRGKIKVGDAEGGMYPYHMLFGALGACFYSTFLDISKKMRLTFDNAKIEVSGEKVDPKAKTIEKVLIKMVISNASNSERILRAAKLGTEYCSIHRTISAVADIKLEVEFQD